MRSCALFRIPGWAIVLLALSASPSLAHHVMGGKLPSTFFEGFLSGLGHPIIGLDHLAFLVALSMAAALLNGPFVIVATFIVMSIAGVMIHLAQMDIPLVEPLIALTVLLAGLALVWRHSVAGAVWFALAAVAGLLHGYAFGESIVGAERAALGAYLLGIAVVMAAIAITVVQLTRRILRPDGLTSPHLHVAGLVIGCIGAVLLAGTVFFD